MVAIDYNIMTSNKFESIDRELNSANRTLSWFVPSEVPIKFVRRAIFYFLRKRVLKFNHKLSEIFLESKGILAILNEAKLSDKDDDQVKKLIVKIDKIIVRYSEIDSMTEKIVNDHITSELPELQQSLSLIRETISVNYDILRALKRYSKKSPIETSEIALQSSKRSLNSLETVLNGRRTT